jgi:hypothetical protein
MLQRAVETSGISPDRLCVEVPVQCIGAVADAAQKAARLHDCGIQISLSDFTDDQISRHALALVEPDMVMLDARHLGSSAQARDAATLLRSACVFARSRGVAVHARGVETRAQLEAVRDWGCDGVQGYLLAQPFSRAMAGADPRSRGRARSAAPAANQFGLTGIEVRRNARITSIAVQMDLHWHISCIDKYRRGDKMCPLITIPEGAPREERMDLVRTGRHIAGRLQYHGRTWPGHSEGRSEA